MNSTVIALASAACIFAGALLGLALQRLLPAPHLNKETQDVVKLGAVQKASAATDSEVIWCDERDSGKRMDLRATHDLVGSRRAPKWI